MFKDDDQREISRQRGEFRHFVDKNYVEDDQSRKITSDIS